MTAWADVKGHLLDYLPNLAGLTDPDAVSDGPTLAKADLENYAHVGWDGDVGRGGYEQDYDLEPMVSETGEVPVTFVARSGDTDLDALQSACDGWVDALRTHFLADKTLGGLLTQGSTVSVGRVDINAAQTENGAIVTNTATIRYFARL